MKIYNIVLAAFIVLAASTSVFAQNKHDHSESLLVHTIGYDILKQREKLIKDPTDIKEADLYKFKYVCDDPYFSDALIKYTPTKFSDDVTDTCKTILKL